MIIASEIERDPAIRGAGLGEIAETGSALILDSAADSTVGFGGCVFRTFPEYLGAYRSWLVQEEGRAMVRVERRPDLETVYLECIPPTVAELLRDEGLRAQDIAVVLPPQISAEFARRLAERLQVSPDRFVDVAEPGRDLSSSTLVHSLLAARRRGAVRPGDVGLAVNVGSGVQIGAAIYYF
jgi:3-oxoacyl-[acyl-carrier-protein] synthase III